VSNLDSYFKEARDLLRQDSAGTGVEQQLWRSMNLQHAAAALLEKAEMRAWGTQQAYLNTAAELAKALSKIHLADHLARLIAAVVAVNAAPGGEQEKEMVDLFENLSSPPSSQFFDADRQKIVAQDCVTALSIVCAYHNEKIEDPSRAKISKPGDHGNNLSAMVMARLFRGALLDDPENLIESYAVIAKSSPPDSPERLAAVLGLIRYPQYAGFRDGSNAEGYIENLAPIGSVIRHEAEELLKNDAAFPLKDLLEHARIKKQEFKQ